MSSSIVCPACNCKFKAPAVAKAMCPDCGALIAVSASTQPIADQPAMSGPRIKPWMVLLPLVAFALAVVGGAFWIIHTHQAVQTSNQSAGKTQGAGAKAGPAINSGSSAGNPTKSATAGQLAVTVDAVEVDYVQISQFHATRGYIGSKRSPDKMLNVKLTLTNKGDGEIICHHPDPEETKLTDEEGSRFKTADWLTVEGMNKGAKLSPGATTKDLLVFSASNLGHGRQLLLEFQLLAGGTKHAVKLSLDQKSIAK
jgi:hypothetical protein